MKYPLRSLLMLLCLVAGKANAQPRSEEELVSNILASLQNRNTGVHLSLFPSFDTLWSHVMRTPDSFAMRNLRMNPQKLQQYDPVHNPQIAKDFDRVIQKGVDSGLHWNEMIMSRYEFEKMILTRDMVGIEKITEMREQGYILVSDMLTRRSYIIMVTDIQSIKGKWYGGHVINVLEAENTDEFLDKLAYERKMEKKKLLAEMYGEPEPIKEPEPEVKKEKPILAIDTEVPEDEDDEGNNKKHKIRKEISERKYYVGRFDDSPVELYVRGMKGGCPDPSCSWEAIYKFQGSDEYIRLIVSRAKDGSWIFTEEPDVGSMELTLAAGKYKGVWISAKDKTEYEVELTEKKEIRGNKLWDLDNVIENEQWAQ